MAQLRRFLRREGAAFSLLLLASSVGMTAALAALFETLVLNPLDVPGAGRLIAAGGLSDPPAPTDPVDWWGQASALEELAHYTTFSASIGDPLSPTSIGAAIVSSQFFEVLSARPLGDGSWAAPEEGQRVVVLGEAISRTLFGDPASAVGAEVKVNGVSFHVGGVVGNAFEFPNGTQVWLRGHGRQRLGEAIPQEGERRWIGRLAEGATTQGAQAALLTLLGRLNAEATPNTKIRYGDRVSVSPLADSMSRRFRSPITLLLVAAVLVLVGGAVNFAVFVLGLDLQRSKEHAIRQALGEDRKEALRRHALEIFLCALVIAVASATIAIGVVQGVGYLLPSEPAWRSVRWRASLPAVVAAFVLSISASLPAMVLPRLAWGCCGARGLLGEGKGLRQTVRNRDRLALVSVQVYVAFLAAVFSLEAMTSYLRLALIERGFSSDNVVVVKIQLARSNLEAGRLTPRLDELLLRVAARPGATAVGMATNLPIPAEPRSGVFIVRSGPPAFVVSSTVGGDYFAALRLLVRGRSFHSGDGFVVMVDEAAAATLWPDGRNPVGEMLRLDGEKQAREVVGVTKRVAVVDTAVDRSPQIYLPLSSPYRGQLASALLSLIVRYDGKPEGRQAIERGIRDLGQDVTVVRVSSLAALVDAGIETPRTQVLLLGVYAGVSICVALLGLSGAVRVATEVRRFEIGVRLAVGGKPLSVAFFVAEGGARACAAGLLIGLASVPLIHRALESVLLGLGRSSPMIPPAIAVLGFLSGLLASLLPAFRTARENPSEILRDQ